MSSIKKQQQPQKPQRNFYSLIIDIIFFIFFFCYIWLVIDPSLYYQTQEPVYFSGSRFLSEFLNHPGGVTENLSALLSQFYFFPWLGAFVITLVVVLITLATKTILRIAFHKDHVEILHLVPAIILLALHNCYDHLFVIDLGLALSLFFFIFYLRVAPQQPILRFVVYLVLALLLYYLAAGPFFLFVVLAGLYELLINRQYWIGIVMLLIPIPVPYLGAQYLFLVSFKDSYWSNLPIQSYYLPKYFPYILYLFLPICLIIGSFWASLSQQPKISKQLKSVPILVKALIQFFILTAATVVVVYFFYKKDVKTFLRIDYYAQRDGWNRILQLVKPLNQWNPIVAFQTNRALSHEGLLPYDMFSYSQLEGTNSLFLSKEMSYKTPILRSDLFFELGHVNEAEHWLLEAIAVKGYSVRNLKRLADIKILKGEAIAAQKCLLMLDKTILAHNWAKQRLKGLADNSLLATDKKLQHIKSLMVDQDFKVNGVDPSQDMLKLLEKNRHNQMAFEYLMADYLLTGEVGNLVSQLDRLDDFNCTAIPRHYEEALLIYISEKGSSELPVHNKSLTVNRVQAFKDFQSILARYKGNKAAAYQEIIPKYSNSYWAYLTYFKTKAQQQQGK
jgi:hypothetical protein